MGNKVVAFTEEQLDEYQACTFLSRKDILRAQRMFRQLSECHLPPVVERECAASLTVPYAALDTLTELKENPFRRRVCEVFSTNASASLTFDQFLEMFSVFSEHAPRDIKAIYAFRIYDFDGDGFLGESDLLHAVKHLSHDLLTPDEYNTIVAKVQTRPPGGSRPWTAGGPPLPIGFIPVILKMSPIFVPNFPYQYIGLILSGTFNNYCLNTILERPRHYLMDKAGTERLIGQCDIKVKVIEKNLADRMVIGIRRRGNTETINNSVIFVMRSSPWRGASQRARGSDSRGNPSPGGTESTG
ncbi:calcium and integrin-binding family member 3-like [Penaeus monodon]|uniref:calcium and integrin-binding family member 3-like n=1 Tax=Penaeus monodon TaxID=6687 RepID=UPI0018A7BF00|nr:calcium and integrin-binding family member 3-like [Penaeus monodon]